MRRINSHLHSKDSAPYVVNLDPATLNLPFDCNIDIRQSVKYRDVMKHYNLGPNGAIMTSLNLFATKVDQMIGLLEKRAQPDPEHPERKPVKHIIVDTRESQPSPRKKYSGLTPRSRPDRSLRLVRQRHHPP